VELKMKLTTNQREALRNKLGGKCAYCGCELKDKWHADHVKPVIRYKGSQGYAMVNPELDVLENLVPACHGCNLHKHSFDVEHYREIIHRGRQEFLRSGKGKALVRMGLVSMKDDPIVFWFERYQEAEDAA